MRYRMRFRPVSFCTIPSGLVWEFVEAPRDHPNPFGLPVSAHRFGVFTTARPLTGAELDAFEIEEVA